ncbi:fasciclin domain-containing protein [Microbacterium sp. STN6]|uniref:fasciclin domain-containing protein n=1 Tax=Microbacterium sp. STN6 TaxID=2995588 RepID=UPI002260E950|nr:fasciclin domain-containing protein [Microbacterium sp. STN6]MCX7520757.1 fasciclin domain-containing protein [Microbacterium sp. STN6]
MRTTHRTIAATVGVLAVAALSLTACSSDSGSNASDTMKSSPKTSSSSPSTMDAAASLVGPGCSAYADKVPSGPGSVKGMAQDPVATAASNNPLLTTLVAAVSGKLNPKVNLVDTLNSGQYTVFAPVDDAFAKIDAATLDTLKTPEGADTLTKILTYHVISGQLSPSEIDGTHKTVEGDEVTVAGSGDDMTVNGNTHVICGGVTTANATVYLIDGVLMPPSM